MKRFNYLGSRTFATRRRLHARLAVDDRIRGPLSALAATVALTATIAAIQLARLHAAQDAYAVCARRLAVSERNVASIRTLQRHVDVEARLARRLNDLRSESLNNVARIAWVGNHLPHDTWLRSLRYENGTYSLDGTAARMAAVGNAMLALHVDDRTGMPQLVSIRDDRNDATARIEYTLRLEQAP